LLSAERLVGTSECASGTRVARFAFMTIQRLLRPTSLFFALCLGAVPAACAVNDDDDDDDGGGDDVDVEVEDDDGDAEERAACRKSCGDSQVDCEDVCAPGDPNCVVDCQDDFHLCHASC
jgi:hypothetical protein